MIKDRKGKDLTEEEEIKKKWQEYTDKLYNKGVNDSVNHSGVVTHLELDILECEVNWALENITMNKASEGDRIPFELFKILKENVVKVLHSTLRSLSAKELVLCKFVSKFEKLSSSHRTGKGHFSCQSQRMFRLLNSCTHFIH